MSDPIFMTPFSSAETDLTGDTSGQRQSLDASGLLTQYEDGRASELLAINQHTFDDDPEHIHGGEIAAITEGQSSDYAAGDRRIQSAGNATVENSSAHVQLGSNYQIGGSGPVLQNSGQETGQVVGLTRKVDADGTLCKAANQSWRQAA